ncbi:MAG: threonine ammonia-lyase [Blautia sp.]|nr:threonine ammonia-lyase [Blautia sp.]
MLTLENFEKASEIVRKVTQETKLIESPYFSELTGNKVYFKPENMQRTGSFKVRGAYYKISTLTDDERSRGVIAASSGNHALGAAYAAHKYVVKAVVVMPNTTPLIKVERAKDYGAEVILYGDTIEQANEYAMQQAEEKGYTFIHSYDDPAVATGQGTIAMEIIQELPLVDYILVPVGGGGLAAGVAALAGMLNPHIKVIGVEPAGAACLALSRMKGERTRLDSVNTIADGAAAACPGESIYQELTENLDSVITIEDDELIVAFLDMVENHRMIVENAGLLTTAALRHLDFTGKKVVSVLSGGNMDVITMSSVVQHGLIQRDRIFTVSVLIPDKAGELVRVATIIAENKGNVIKLDHNQFVSTNRNAAVELKITMEAYGTDHKRQIVRALEEAGCRPKVIRPSL